MGLNIHFSFCLNAKQFDLKRTQNMVLGEKACQTLKAVQYRKTVQKQTTMTLENERGSILYVLLQNAV